MPFLGAPRRHDLSIRPLFGATGRFGKLRLNPWHYIAPHRKWLTNVLLLVTAVGAPLLSFWLFVSPVAQRLDGWLFEVITLPGMMTWAYAFSEGGEAMWRCLGNQAAITFAACLGIGMVMQVARTLYKPVEGLA